MTPAGSSQLPLIGVLGGTSWPSTTLPYRMLNEEVQRRLGPPRSARVLVYSIDYGPIKTRYHNGWDEIPILLLAEIQTLLGFGPACWMLANNTLHKAYDLIAGEIGDAPPFMHAVRLVRDDLLGRGFRRVLLTGTQFTMEDGFFARPLVEAGLDVVVPGHADREAIQAMQTYLARGVTDPAFEPAFAALLARYAAAGCEAVITACTELPLVVTQRTTTMAVVDPLVLQCRACVDYALFAESRPKETSLSP